MIRDSSSNKDVAAVQGVFFARLACALNLSQRNTQERVVWLTGC